ncbi:MAG: hypothetical protein WCS31_12310 [Verrucomicrobiae bacterium]
MKLRIQKEMAEEEARLGREETQRRAEAWKESNASPLANWWRKLVGTEDKFSTASTVREDPPKP